MLPLIASVGARLLAAPIAEAVAARAVTAGATEAFASGVGQVAGRATVMGGDYAAQRIAQRQQEQRGFH